MLPHFFRHYDDLVDRYFIFDNGSSDGTLDMLAAHGRVQTAPFAIEDDSFVETERRLSDIIWQASRGIADWVIIVDVDEHLHHPDLRGYLHGCAREGVTAIMAVGYEMVASVFPTGDVRLSETIARGVPSHFETKPCVFNPAAITETNFSYGRHCADLSGRVVWPNDREVLLLHYKQLGLGYVTSRSQELGTKFPERDVKKGFGLRYRYSTDMIAAEFTRLMALAAPIPQLSRQSRQEAVDSPTTAELARLNQLLAERNTELWRLNRIVAHCQAQETHDRKG